MLQYPQKQKKNRSTVQQNININNKTNNNSTDPIKKSHKKKKRKYRQHYLSKDDQQNFSRYVRVFLRNEITVTRYWDGYKSYDDGRYWSIKDYSCVHQARNELALLPEWNDMKFKSISTIPAGTVVYLGPASQKDCYPGGALQLYIHSRSIRKEMARKAIIEEQIFP